jgi:hypothetical protein
MYYEIIFMIGFVVSLGGIYSCIDNIYSTEEPTNTLTVLLNDVSETYYEKKGTNECIICLEPYDDKELRVLYCFHSFHKKCIDKWLHVSKKNECPICHFNIV